MNSRSPQLGRCPSSGTESGCLRAEGTGASTGAFALLVALAADNNPLFSADTSPLHHPLPGEQCRQLQVPRLPVDAFKLSSSFPQLIVVWVSSCRAMGPAQLPGSFGWDWPGGRGCPAARCNPWGEKRQPMGEAQERRCGLSPALQVEPVLPPPPPTAVLFTSGLALARSWHGRD